jgi:hypothetical protein
VVTFPRADRWKAVARSLIVPGGGQRYLGRTTRAAWFSTLVAASAAGAILAQDAFLDARRDHLAAQRRLHAAVGDDEALRATVDEAASTRDFRSTLRWVLAGTAASIYLWNVVDALFVGGGAQGHAPPVTLAPTASGLAVSWRFDFP